MICPNSKTTPKKLLKNAKAVSPVVATLLMIVISVVAGVMIYGWISGFIATGVPSVPTAYIVTISSVTVYDVRAANETVLKVAISNPGAKDIDVTSKNFVITLTNGTVKDYTTTGLKVFEVDDAAIAAHGVRVGTAANTTSSAALIAGKTTYVYVGIAGADSGTVTGALTKGNTYTINTRDASTYDGIAVTSAELPFKANK